AAVGVGILGCSVQEGASAEVRALDLVDDPAGDRADRGLGRVPALGDGAYLGADVLVGRPQVGDDQIVLARKMAVEGRSCDASLRHDLLDADGVDSLGVEDRTRGAQQSVSSFGGTTNLGLAGHVTILSTERSVQ